jgi:uncharacterized caspase-like protein
LHARAMKSPVRRLFKTSVLGLTLLSLTSVAQAPLDIRVALVIGNAAYRHASPLANAVNDAKSMGMVLRKLGFKVVDVMDGDRTAMTEAITQVRQQLQGQQAVAMLYFAGHGMQLDWRNYLVPVDARISKAIDVPAQTVDIEQVTKTFQEASTRMNIIVLDACRDNPFSGSTGTKGLAQLDAPPGTYFAFATSPGNVAEDGDDDLGNGLFTHYLIKELQRPAKIEDVFKRVRLQVRKKSEGRQIPWDSSSLEEDFAFNDGKKFSFSQEDYLREMRLARDREAQLKREADAAAEKEQQLAEMAERVKQALADAQRIQEQKARAQAEAQARERELQLARETEQMHMKAVAAAQALEQARAQEALRLKDLEWSRLQAQEEERRKKMSAEAARERQFAEEKAEWDKIKDSKNADDFYAFLLKYPNGLISQQATFALESLAKAKISAQPDKTGQVQRVGESRFRLGDRFVRAVRDDYSGRTIKQLEFRVHKIENGLIYFRSAEDESITTLDGAVVQSVSTRGVFKYDPPFLNIPGDEFAVGKKWSTMNMVSSPFGMYKKTTDIKIVAYEQITIPAGTFWAYKIQSVGWNGNTREEVTYWHTPEWGGLRLKYILKLTHPRGAPTLESAELIAIERGPA